MNELVTIVVVGLAAYRVARLIAEDTILDRPRRAILDSRLGTTKIASFVTCPFCIGVWAGAAVFVAWTYGPSWLRACALAAAAIGLQALCSAADERMVG